MPSPRPSSSSTARPPIPAAPSLQPQGAGKPKRLVTLQLYSATSLAVELHRGADGTYGYKLAPNATANDDERVSSVPSTTQAARRRRPLGRGRLGAAW